jgi:glycosyltransferase involved in cell wall biosynthesis
MPRLIFVNRFFFPDHSATSQILSDLAFHLADAGKQVHVVTSTQIYDDAKAALPTDEIINGVHVHRVASTGFGRSGLLGRLVDYLSFYRSVRQCLNQIAESGDAIVAKTDPPLLSVVAMAPARRHGARLINWLQDIYPETAVELNVPLMRGPVAAILAGLRNRSLRQAEATVVVGSLMGQKVRAYGAAAAGIHVIPNWCDDEAIKPVAQADNPLRQAWGLDSKFVLGYSGNLGRAHEFDTALAAAERLRGDPHIVFLMTGGGKRFDELAGMVKRRGLQNSFRFMPYQQRTTLRHSLGVPDMHWLSLNPRLEGLMVPSKFYGIAAAGRPMIVIADSSGELARLVQDHGCGVVIEPGDADALASAISRFSRGPELVATMGQRARTMLDAHFTRTKQFERWRELLNQVDKPQAIAHE